MRKNKEIYKFLLEKKLLSKEAPYIYVNCRYYTKNINALNDVLFGDTAGIENSCFEKAQGGMLFVDNADLMDAKQYGRICQYLETGDIFSEGESPVEWKNSVTVGLPTLAERSLSEKLQLINLFFEEEAANSNCQIEVTTEVIRALMALRFACGIKELRLEVKSACA